MYGAKVGWGRWTTHLLGAVVAAIVVPIFVGTVLVKTGGGSPGVWFRATADAAVEAILDFTVRNRTVTSQVGHHLLILGLICWATAQFAGFAVLGHRRPLGAVFVTGLVLLTNISITIRDQLPFLVIFTCAALLLLVRVHADDEKASWLQRRIGDPSAVTGLYLRGGVAFVTIAVLGSLFLTSTAASAPLAGAFSGSRRQARRLRPADPALLPGRRAGHEDHRGQLRADDDDLSDRWETRPRRRR